MKRYIYLMVVLSFLAGSCSDNTPDFPTNSSVEENEDTRISSFDIDPSLLDGELVSKIGYANLKKGFFNLETYHAELYHQGSSVRCGLHLSTSSSLENGDYLLTFSDSEGMPLKGMLCIEVEDNRIIKVTEANGSFSLRSGSGTQEDPYRIGSARDFLTFLDDLRLNELTNGRDVWFQQTADIDLMDQSYDKPGRGFFGYSFAGHYDGGGYALKGMYYRGAENAESDTRLGIFPSLLDGATVSNLTISGVNVSKTYADTGTLAGTIVGTVSISGIKMTGSVISDNANNVGAFIGRMEKGTFTASDMKLCGSIEGHKNVGGIIGRIDNGKAYFSEISTPDYHFSIEGNQNVGGIIGSVNECELTIENSELKHVVSKEDADIRLVQTSGGDATGGIVGLLNGSKSANISDVTVSCPVGGLNQSGNKVGGLIGKVSFSGNLTLDGCRMTSMVSGGKEIGGYIGHCEISGNGKLHIKGDSKVNYVIPDDSAAGIEGVSQIGGVIGQITNTAIQFGSQAKIRVGINVNASDCDCGGAIGKLTNSNIDLTGFDMTSTTMQVNGASCTGGMIGYAHNSTITGNTPFDYKTNEGIAEIPSKDSFTPIYKGIVKGKSETGGILGWGENVSLKALASGCTVETTEGDNIGGIVGKLTTKGTENIFEDLVSMSLVTATNSSNVGGICGGLWCDDFCYTADCINFGNVLGGNDTGGVFGYIHRNYLAYYDHDYKSIDIRWCLNDGDVNGANRVGGIVGEASIFMPSSHDQNSGARIYKCGNNGKIYSGIHTDAASGVGGIVGYAEAHLKLEYNANNGVISSSAAHKGVGGIAGSLGQDAFKDYRTTVMNVEVYYCTNNGTIDATAYESRVGGILGFMEEGPDSYLKNCLNRGEVLHKHQSDNGGILGYVDHLGKIYYCVNLGNVEEGNATIGTHKTGSTFNHDGLYLLDGSGWTWPSGIVIKEEDLCNMSKYSKLDFDDVWVMYNHGPALQNTPFDFKAIW